MIASSTLSNWHLNGILHARLFGDSVKYLGLGKLTDGYIPGSDPVSKDPDFGWIPVPNYSGDAGDAQFLRYALATDYNFIIEPQGDQISVTMEFRKLPGKPVHVTNAVEITEARATAVAIYTMLMLEAMEA
jgi:hypothetical protein